MGEARLQAVLIKIDSPRDKSRRVTTTILRDTTVYMSERKLLDLIRRGKQTTCFPIDGLLFIW